MINSLLMVTMGLILLITNSFSDNEKSTKSTTETIKLYKKNASEGNITASYILGVMYLSGLDVKKDTTKAVDYLRVPAKSPLFHDSSMAKYYLAMALELKNKEKNKEEIITMLSMSAIEGCVKAQVILGHGYILGEDVEKDMKKAKTLIGWAKDRNDTKAIKLWEKYKLWEY